MSYAGAAIVCSVMGARAQDPARSAGAAQGMTRQ